MASSFVVKEMSKALECAICLAMVKNPRRLDCEHSFCKNCLDKLLEFAVDGSCTIRCPKQCPRYTLISNKSTTNDLGVDYMMKSIIDVVTSNDESMNLVENKQTCDCNKDISRYCRHCDSFLCRSCCCFHKENQYFPVMYDTDDEQIKVKCEKHSTDANYLCCDPCGNEFICLYCSHRDHIGHSYDTLQNQAERMKDNLRKEIQNISDFNKNVEVTLQRTESDISTAKEVLNETLTYRKLLCLGDYLHYLNKEEERLNAQFDSITENHRKQYEFKEDYTELYEVVASKEGISLIMQTMDVLNNVSTFNSDKVNITEETVTLSDHCFNVNHPLGNIGVKAGKHIAVDGVCKYFKSKFTNTDIGDKSKGDNEVNLYENLQYLLQESFPKIKEDSNNLMQENEVLKDSLTKLKKQNEEIVTMNNDCDKAYNSLTDQYNELQKQFEESNKQLSDEIAKKEEENNRNQGKLGRCVIEGDSNRKILVCEKEEKYMDPKMQQEQEPLIASIFANVSQKEQKQMIGERLVPLVKKITLVYSSVIGILLTMDNVKLLKMLESPQLLSAEVKRAQQYDTICTDKIVVAQAVKMAMASDKKFLLYSSLDANKQEPITASILATLSLREQKQMIAERLLPLVKKIEPMYVFIMKHLLVIDNMKLLNMLVSPRLLSAEVERAKQYDNMCDEKGTLDQAVAHSMANNTN